MEHTLLNSYSILNPNYLRQVEGKERDYAFAPVCLSRPNLRFVVHAADIGQGLTSPILSLKYWTLVL